MRCILCHNLSFSLICTACRHTYLQPTPSIRMLDAGFRVYSFYRYHEIAPILKRKHTYIGAALYRMLAAHAFDAFKSAFAFPLPVGIVPVDDHTKNGYAHTAIIARGLQTDMLRPCYRSLRARNDIRYAGKTLTYRKRHPRGFRYDCKRYENVIIVDDIVTTGTTISEAREVIEKVGATPIFAITLADAREV